MTDTAHARHQHHGHEPAAAVETDPGLRHERGPRPPRAAAPTLPAASISSAGRAAASGLLPNPSALSATSRCPRRRRLRRGRCGPARCTPEIVREGPDSCPICGMALEPMTRRQRCGQPRAGPDAALLGRGCRCRCWSWRWPSTSSPDGIRRWPRAPRSGSSWRSRHRSCCGAARRSSARLAVAGEPPSEHVHADRRSAPASPISTASSQRSVPGIFPASFRGPRAASQLYFEAAAVIVTLVLLGQVLELRARSPY